ncbi:glycoside hydrolase family 9 protein [Cellvibrio fibrivorans]|uniref:Endoglucanase n=1 Tax=Cellvibrio fibrivorans TaxID=126350 RepID=A0ABU1V0W4_9GAMM|nr:glycoside hydrolase family 9 protein [Cellvibrio fibrivorans]MDR7091091.1 endoglucanase [Cellvibrio fibrivorans]
MAVFIPTRLASALALVGLTGVMFGCGSGGGGSGGNSAASSKAASSAAAVAISSAAASSTAAVAGNIKLNQLGFLPESAKWAVVPAGSAATFKVINTATNAAVLSGNLSAATTWSASEESVRLADFSSVKTPGDYLVRVDGVNDSYPFTIANDVYSALTAASIKAFYYNRNSAELLATHAGIFARPLGHPDTQVLVHPSAASAARPTGTIISSPKGWYDAGDYNKYIVNSGIATYSLLAAYEHFPEMFNNQNLNIPESGDALPDLLNETLWNLEWMLSMQDPNDGGVYHKLTNKNFDGTVMPHQATSERYVVQKTTAAALDFAAVMATASRVVAQYEAQLPGMSAKMLAAAESAWGWAVANPAVTYKQPDDVKTGEYGDGNLADEFAWAAAELYITSKKDAYYTAMKPAETFATVPSWGDVRSLGWISLAHHRDNLTAVADKQLIANRIDGLAANLQTVWSASAYRVTMQKNDFVWGSNSVALGQAMMLVQGYRLNGKREYLDAAQAMLDYVLGRNATDMSFVTGYGDKATLHPHHRPSEADGIAEPIPGFIAGGPQPGQQDKSGCNVPYPSNIAAKSYLDNWCSYASNEIAINWNAPLVYVSAAIQALTPK